MEFLKFEPLLKQTIWGGDKIIPFKHLEKSLDQVGESWEVSGVKDNETVVANGEYKGWKLNDVLAEQKELLVGKENYARYGSLSTRASNSPSRCTPTTSRLSRRGCRAARPRCGM